MTSSAEPPRARAPSRASRGPRCLAAMIAGASVEDIATQEKLRPKRVEQILRDELRRRWVAPAEDYARLQIARLERLAAGLADSVEAGDLAAIDRWLKIIDRLDRYHGFSRVSRNNLGYDPSARERLMTKINTVAARLTAGRADGA